MTNYSLGARNLQLIHARDYTPGYRGTITTLAEWSIYMRLSVGKKSFLLQLFISRYTRTPHELYTRDLTKNAYTSTRIELNLASTSQDTMKENQATATATPTDSAP